MSFHEISIAVRAENRASATFRSIALDVANLGVTFGLLSNEQAKAVSVFFTVIRVIQSLAAIINTATIAQTAHNSAAAAGATVQMTLTGSTVQSTAVTWGQVVAQQAAAVATWLHAHGQLVLIGALTFGVGAIVAVTAALWAMAEANRAAAQSVNMLNSTMMESSGYGYGYDRNIQRAGEEALRRRGIE